MDPNMSKPRMVDISLSELWDFYQGDDSGTDTVATAHSYQLEGHRDSDGSLDYIDLIDPTTGDVLCCDGESCEVVAEDSQTGAFTLWSLDSESLPFTLSRDEARHAIFE